MVQSKELKKFTDAKKIVGNEVVLKILQSLNTYGISSVEDIVATTNIYPSTVRESIHDMYNKNLVIRTKKEVVGLGKKPYLYELSPNFKEIILNDVEKNKQAFIDLF